MHIVENLKDINNEKFICFINILELCHILFTSIVENLMKFCLSFGIRLGSALNFLLRNVVLIDN